jgi:hypothetical protein
MILATATNEVSNDVLCRSLQGKVGLGEDPKRAMALAVDLRCKADDALRGNIGGA